MFRALYEYGILYADRHPGELPLHLDDEPAVGVAFLDFGCTGRRSPITSSVGMKRYVIAAQNGDQAAFERGCVDVLGFDPSDVESWKLYNAYTNMHLQPLVIDAPFRHTSAKHH